jgi:cytidylate kinase
MNQMNFKIKEVEMNTKKSVVITISRQLGAGGASIGILLARKLNLFYADREIISKASAELSVLEEDVESYDEKVRSFWDSLFQGSSFSPDLYIPQEIKIIPTDAELFKTQSEIIKEIAEKHAAVIMGRCGFHILKDLPNCARVFIHADFDARVKRIQQLKNVSEETAEKLIRESDKERALYVNKFTEKKWGDADSYDLTINTTKIGIDNSAEVIISYLNYIGV